jgi:hypothetical protein
MWDPTASRLVLKENPILMKVCPSILIRVWSLNRIPTLGTVITRSKSLLKVVQAVKVALTNRMMILQAPLRNKMIRQSKAAK